MWLTVLCCWVLQHRVIWIVIGKMFINQSSTKDKAVINVKTVQILSMNISAEMYFIKKSIFYEMQHLMQIA